MAQKFGKHYPVLSRTNDRERLLFVAAAGLAFSLLIILVVVFTFKNPASAKRDVPVKQAPPAVVGTITLLTPEREVKGGASMSNVRLKEIYWPRNQVPSSAVRDLSEVQNMYARVNLSPGVPLQREMLTREMVESILEVTPGNRAVTIAVDEVTSIENHATPGTRVDVVLTYYQNRELTSKVIVQNARVLSLGGDPRRNQGSRGVVKNAGASRTLTLDVSAHDALEIKTAIKLGTLSLLMRSADDHGPMSDTEVGAPDIDGGRRKGQRVKRVCKKGTVRISGDEFIMNCDGSLTRVADPYDP